MSTKVLPSSQIPLINTVPKCRCICICPPCWNIPPITNLYPTGSEKPLPLTKMNLKGSIMNSAANISFLQIFQNTQTNPIECVYKFPSDYSFAVAGLTVKVGDKTIEAEVMEKKQAEQKYDDAMAAGHTAVKLNYNEKLPDIIELNVGQLQPGDTAEVTVRMVCELEVIKHGFFSFIFPLEFFPRYGDAEGILGQEGTLLTAEFSAEFTIRSTSVITNLDVSNKGVTYEQSEDGQEVRLVLEASKDIIAKDFVISYSTEQIREPQITLSKCDKYPGEIAAHISYIPRSSDEHEVDEDEEQKDFDKQITEIDDHDDPEVANGEFIFILDRSGSMGGDRIKSALAALALFIRSIPPNSKFNIVSFGSNYVSMYPSSLEFNNANMDDALNKISSFDADLGGTELYAPIEYVLSQSYDHKCPKNVFVLTDGDISDTQNVLDKVREFNHHTRVHSFGIGSGASIYLVKELAKEGRGSSTLIADNDPQMKAKVIRTLRLASKPAFTNMTADWHGNSKSIKLYVPQSPIIPSIYEEESFHYYAIFSEKDLSSGTVDLTFFNTFEGDSQTISLKVDTSLIKNSNDGKEFQLAAKHYIPHLKRASSEDKKSRDDEIVSISVKYSVLSNKTAFFGKIKNSTKSTEEMETIEIPIKSLQSHASPSYMPMSFSALAPPPAMMCNMAMPSAMRCPPPPTSCMPSYCRNSSPPTFYNQSSKSASCAPQMDLMKKNSCYDDEDKCCDELGECCDDYEEEERCEMMLESNECKDDDQLNMIDSLCSKSVEENDIKETSHKIIDSSKPSDQQIIESQDSTGFFSQLPSAFAHLSTSPVPKSITDIVSDSDEIQRVWITILCICILRKHFKSSQDEWSLIAKKAEAYLKGQKVKNFKDEIKNAMSFV